MAEYIEREDTINSKPEGRNPEQSGKEEYNKGWNDCRRYFVQIIESQTAADVAPVVHGHWKHVAGMNSKCSVCERYFPVNEFVKRPFDINYCPNCGAKMDEVTK